MKDVLLRFKRFLVTLINFFASSPRFTVVLFVSFLFILLKAKPLDVYVTVDTLINKDDEAAQEYFALKKDFNLHTNAFLLLEKKSGGALNEEELCQVRKWAVDTGLKFPHIQESHSPLFIRKSLLDVSPEGFRRLTFPPLIHLDCLRASGSEYPLSSVSQSPWGTLLVRRDFKDVVHEYQIDDLDEKNFAMEKIVPLMEELKATVSKLPDSIRVHWLGDASYQAEMVKGILMNNALNSLVVVLIIVGFRVFFGTWKAGLIYILTLIYSCALIFGAMSLTDTPMDVLNSSLFLFLAVSSVGDFIFLSQHELDHHREGRSWLETFRDLAISCWFTSFTTFIGFISLCTSEVEMVARLGLWVGISGILEWLVVFLALPSILKLLFKEKSWVDRSRAVSLRPLRIIEELSLPRKFCWGLLAVFLVAPFCFQRLNITDSPMELFQKDNPFRESLNYLMDTRGFKGEVSLVFNDSKDEAFNRPLLKRFKGHPNVTRVEDPYEISDFYTKGLDDLESELLRTNLKQTSQFKRYFSEEKLRAVLYLKEAELSNLAEMRREVKALCPNQECGLSGMLIAYADFSQNVSHTLISSFGLSFCLVVFTTIFLAWGTSNLKYLFPLLASSLWGGAMVILILSVFQVKINFVTSLVLAIMVGMNGDNTIQFILSGMGKGIYHGVKERALGSVITTFLLMLSSLVFLFHYFEPPKVFGLLLMCGFLLSLVGDLWILKGLLPKEEAQKNN